MLPWWGPGVALNRTGRPAARMTYAKTAQPITLLDYSDAGGWRWRSPSSSDNGRDAGLVASPPWIAGSRGWYWQGEAGLFGRSSLIFLAPCR